MQPTTTRRILPVLALALSACGGGGPGPGNYFAQPAPAFTPAAAPTLDGVSVERVTVEIRGVDTERQTLRVARDGQLLDVLYDQNTVVFHADQQWPIVALERGDIVIMELLRTHDALHGGRIDVQDRLGVAAEPPLNLMQLSGRITQLDHERGSFVLHTGTGDMHVTLPAYPTVATRAAFHRLRIGADVKLDATPAGNGHFEIYRFR